jgi:hypothetical protein
MTEQLETKPVTDAPLSVAWFHSVLVPVLIVLMFLYLVMVVAGYVEDKHRLQHPELILGAVVLLFASGVLHGLQRLAVSKDGLEFSWQQVKDEQQKQRQDLDRIHFLIAHLITAHEVAHLVRLTEPPPFTYQRQGAFDKEIRHLRDLGFIEPIPGASPNVESLPREGDLKERFRITLRGHQYLQLRADSHEPAVAVPK